MRRRALSKSGWSTTVHDVVSAAVSRTVTLILVDSTGEPLGALAPFEVASPWWPEVADVVTEARRRYGLDVTVLRLLAADRPAPPGGAVSYLAEVSGAIPNGRSRVPLSPTNVDLAPHPRRAAYAEPGGPAVTLAWARSALQRLGRGTPTTVTQERTWNLSAIWRLRDHVGTVWLKQVPPFFGHEAAVLSWLGANSDAAAPNLLAADDQGRSLLDHIPGEDCFGAGPSAREAMIAQLHAAQTRAAGAVDDLIALGVPDLRGERLATLVRAVAERHGAAISGITALVAGLDERLSAVRRCGLPDTLVHGDFHPGNVRGDGRRTVILDWGDCFIGHPVFDALRMVGDLEGGTARDLLDIWVRQWQQTVPGCDPATAVDLLRPVAALHSAATYAAFVDRIEPTEWPYHVADVPDWLHRAAALA
jgi:hypothetical protein